MAVCDAYVFPGFLTPVLTQLFLPKPPTTFLTCFCRGVAQEMKVVFHRIENIVGKKRKCWLPGGALWAGAGAGFISENGVGPPLPILQSLHFEPYAMWIINILKKCMLQFCATWFEIRVQGFLHHRISRPYALFLLQPGICTALPFLKPVLTLSQTTTLRLFQTERVCRRQFQI